MYHIYIAFMASSSLWERKIAQLKETELTCETTWLPFKLSKALLQLGLLLNCRYNPDSEIIWDKNYHEWN